MPQKATSTAEAKPGDPEYRSEPLDTEEAELDTYLAFYRMHEERMDEINRRAANDPLHEPPELRAAREAQPRDDSHLWIDSGIEVAEDITPEADSDYKPSVGPID